MSENKVGMYFSVQRITTQEEVVDVEAPSSFSFCPEELGIDPLQKQHIIDICNMAMRVCSPSSQKTRFRITIAITTDSNTSSNCLLLEPAEWSCDDFLERIFRADMETPLFRLSEEPLGVEERKPQNLVAQFNEHCAVWLEETKDFEKTLTTNTYILEEFSQDEEDSEYFLKQFASMVDFRYAHPAPLLDLAAAPESSIETDDMKAVKVDIADNTVFVPGASRSSECLKELFDEVEKRKESAKKPQKIVLKPAAIRQVRFLVSDTEFYEFDGIDLTDTGDDKK